jgi:hypothetical protein
MILAVFMLEKMKAQHLVQSLAQMWKTGALDAK